MASAGALAVRGPMRVRAPGLQKPDDPQYYFGEAVLAAFADHRVRRGDPGVIAGTGRSP